MKLSPPQIDTCPRCGEGVVGLEVDHIERVNHADTRTVQMVWTHQACGHRGVTRWSADRYEAFVSGRLEEVARRDETNERMRDIAKRVEDQFFSTSGANKITVPQEDTHEEDGPVVTEPIPRSEIIGRQVQGMRIDLDAVETPADMIFFWSDQERREPWSVRREA